MPAPRDILRRLLLVLLAAALGLGVYLMNAGGIARNELPMPFGVGLATVESNSMAPAFQRGDLLVVGSPSEVPAIGDIVVYRDQSIGLVVHRVVSVSGDLVTTQGDANNTADVPFDSSLIVGRVLLVIPAAGALVAALKTPVGMLVVLALAFLLVEMPFRRHRAEDEDERRRLRAQIAQLKGQTSDESNGGEHDDER